MNSHPNMFRKSFAEIYISDYVILQYIYNIKVAGHSRRFEPCFVCAVHGATVISGTQRFSVF